MYIKKINEKNIFIKYKKVEPYDPTFVIIPNY